MWQSLLVYNACPQPQTEATVLVSPSLLQIDTFGKWCRCLHNVCYLKLKKRRYLDKCRLSAPADSTASVSPLFGSFEYVFHHHESFSQPYEFFALPLFLFSHRFLHQSVFSSLSWSVAPPQILLDNLSFF